MNPWKAAALIVPAGLVLGMTAGAASRPVMVQNAKDYWPASVEERRTAYEAPRPFYEGGPQDLTPAAYSFRPNLDYLASAWPDQSEPDYLAPAVAESVETSVAPAPEVHRASAIEAIGDRAEAAAEEALSVAAEESATGDEQALVAVAAAPVPAMETKAF